MSKRVSNKKGQQRVRPARSRRSWGRHRANVSKARVRQVRKLAENIQLQETLARKAEPKKFKPRQKSGLVKRLTSRIFSRRGS